MALAIFDLDNTLLSGDSDYLFGQFLVEKKLVDNVEYERQNTLFYQQYSNQTLDIHQYIRFCTKPLKGREQNELDALHDEFYQAKVKPIIRQQGVDCINHHKAKGDHILIMTATHEYISRPIAAKFNVDGILATDLACENGKITGIIAGTPCFQQGKVIRLQQWLAQNPDHNLDESYFYSDSINDLPLLEAVKYPVVVTPDDKLLAHAESHGWQRIDFC